MNILETLYDGQYIPARPDTPEYRKLCEKSCTYWEQIQKIMGEDFLDAHWNCQVDLESAARLHDFREGFRLAVSLMLDLL